MSNKNAIPRNPTPTPEERRAQIRQGARVFKAKQEALGLYQSQFWMTLSQSGAVREWLRRGGDVTILRKSSQ
jgi:hypothetical protein